MFALICAGLVVGQLPPLPPPATDADLAALSEQLRLDTIASSQREEVIQSAVDAAPSSPPVMTSSPATGGAAFTNQLAPRAPLVVPSTRASERSGGVTYYRPAVCSGGNCGRGYTPVRRFRLFGRR